MNAVEDTVPQALPPLNVSEARKRRRQNRLKPLKNIEREIGVELKGISSAHHRRETDSAACSTSPESNQLDDSSFLNKESKLVPQFPDFTEDSSAISRDEEVTDEHEGSDAIQNDPSRSNSSYRARDSERQEEMYSAISASASMHMEPAVILKVKKHKKEKHKKIEERSSQGEEDRSNTTTISAALNEIIDSVEVIDESYPRKPKRTISKYSDKGSEISLISDGKVYVQRGRSFTATTREKAFSRPSSQRDSSPLRPSSTTALSMSMGYQKKFLPLSTMCHGFLAGIAVWQCITVFQQKGNEDTLNFIESYSNVARIFQSIFYVLSTVACVAVLDRCVPTSLSWQVLWELLVLQPCCLLALCACCGALICCGIAAKLDDRLALHQYNETLWTDSEESGEFLSEWLTLNLVRCVLAVVSYLIVSLSWGDNAGAMPFPGVSSSVKPVTLN